MPLAILIAIVLAVTTYNWLDGKLIEHGMTWTGLGAILAGATALLVLAVWNWARKLPDPDEDADRASARSRRQGEPKPGTHPVLRAGETSLGAAINRDLGLLYRDREMQETRRTVRVLTVIGSRAADGKLGIGRVFCYCQMRRRVRMFLASGIVEAFDPASGEVVGDLGIYLLGTPGLDTTPRAAPIVAASTRLALDRAEAAKRPPRQSRKQVLDQPSAGPDAPPTAKRARRRPKKQPEPLAADPLH